MNNNLPFFFLKHNFDVNVSVDTLAKSILYDMRLGLSCPGSSGQDMIKTWMLPPEEKPANQKVIVIDAGGTNFRSCLVSFDSNGDYEISEFRKTSMPGIERELTKKEFFSQIADNIDYLKNKSDRIGFCFSYSMSITKEGDGISTSFSKEIKAKEVIGCQIGKTLCEELEKRGWNKINKIALLNDTVSALLAGSVARAKGSSYSSYVGFILGTGINSAYIQKSDETQIIVCESGKCDKLPRSDFDISFDKKTVCSGDYQLEKQCSGAYLGAVAYEVLSFAANEGLFSKETARRILELKSLCLIEMDSFLYAPFKTGDKYSTISELCENDVDRQTVYEILEILVERCAKNAAAILSAVCIQSEEGKNPLHPIGILCNGTTFFKTHKLRSKIESYLEQYLTKENGIHYEILSVENDITIGTAVAGLR